MRGDSGECKTAGAAGVNINGRSAPIPQKSTKNNPKERVNGGGEYGECPPEGAKRGKDAGEGVRYRSSPGKRAL